MLDPPNRLNILSEKKAGPTANVKNMALPNQTAALAAPRNLKNPITDAG
jgi:hypothetical protein